MSVLVSTAVILRRTPPSTMMGTSEAPCMLVSTGKMVSGFIFKLVRNEWGTTVS